MGSVSSDMLDAPQWGGSLPYSCMHLLSTGSKTWHGGFFVISLFRRVRTFTISLTRWDSLCTVCSTLFCMVAVNIVLDHCHQICPHCKPILLHVLQRVDL